MSGTVALRKNRFLHANHQILSDSVNSREESLEYQNVRIVDNRRLSITVPVTKDTDIISFEDEPTEWRVKMPCGHALCPNTLVHYCKTELKKGFYRMLCPAENCDTEWSYATVKEYAGLTEEECEHFERLLSDNYMERAARTQKCPFCESMCMRTDESYIRIICPNCKAKKRSGGHEFCWLCLEKWKGDGYRPCGNKNCTGEDGRFKVLRESAMKSFEKIARCPKMRGCPSCGLIIEHTQFCKHMTCFCSCEFCFVCLKIKAKSNNGWPCGPAYGPCILAPIQTTLPGATALQ